MPYKHHCHHLFSLNFFTAIRDVPINEIELILNISPSSLYRERIKLGLSRKWPYRQVIQDYQKLHETRRLRRQLMRNGTPGMRKVLKLVCEKAEYYRLFYLEPIDELIQRQEEQEPLVDEMALQLDMLDVEDDEERKDQEENQQISDILFPGMGLKEDGNDYSWLSRLEPVSRDAEGWMKYVVAK